MMADLFPITVDEMIAEARRECVLRRRVYGRLVDEGKLGAAIAERQIAVMEAIAEKLVSMQGAVQ